MKTFLLSTILVLALLPGELLAQDAMIGELRLFSGNFAPRGWMICDGAELQVAEYSSLYSIIGTYYGGDGRNTFALPDLRGSVPVGAGLSVGENTLTVGQKFKIGRSDSKGISGVGMHYIICVSGVFPARN
jgi:microcystin-dependent protein